MEWVGGASERTVEQSAPNGSSEPLPSNAAAYVNVSLAEVYRSSSGLCE